MAFSLLKLISGFNIFAGSEKGDKLGKIIFISIIAAIIAAAICFSFWKIFIEKKVQNIETYSDCNVTKVEDCSDKVTDAIKKARYKPWVDVNLKVIRIGIPGE